MANIIWSLDKKALLAFKEIQNHFLLDISGFLDISFDLTIVFIVSILICAYFFVTKKWRNLIIYISAVGIGSIIGYIIKHLIDRARPFSTIIPLENLSFPSGHALSATLFFGFLIYILNRSKSSSLIKLLGSAFFSFIIIMVALSRLILGVHWLSDVVGAVIIAVSWLSICIIVINNILTQNKAKDLKMSENSILS